jgi:putative transcriptional regulator
MKFIAGRLLIASPYLSDGNFYRSVIYMIRHDEHGAFGLVINRPGNRTLVDVFADRIGRAPRRDDSIYFGGPVDGPLLALHTVSGLGEPCGPSVLDFELPPEHPGFHDAVASSPLWVTADDDHLTLLVDRTDIQAKFVARYSGWGPGQLDSELEQGGWLIGPPDWKAIFSNPDTMWENAVNRLGRAIIADIVSTPPSSDPQWN